VCAGAVQLRNELTTSFGVEIAPTATFDYPTPAALARFVAQQMEPRAPITTATPAAASDADDAGGEEYASDSGLQLARGGKARRSRAAKPRAQKTVGPAVTASSSPDQQQQQLLRDMLELIGGVLGSQVAQDEPLMAAGLDSLGAVSLRNAVAERFGTELPATAALDFPTADALTGYVMQNIVGLAAGMAVAGDEDAPSLGGSLYSEEWSEGGARLTEVVGASCIYPGSAAYDNMSGFWGAAAAGQELCTVIPANRWDIDRAYSPEVTRECFISAT
jgi:acyl carrier protein